MDEIKISDMDEPVEYTAGEYDIEENNETDDPVYEDDDLSSIAMPVISDMDAVVDYTAVQYEEEDIPSETEEKFSRTGDGLESVAMPVFSAMDAVTGSAAEQTEAEPAAEAVIDPVEAPAADDMYEKPAASSAPAAPEPSKPQPEKTMSAMERRMAEPLDMPGAYVPGEQNAPSKYIPKPPAEQNKSPYVQDQPGISQNNDDFLDKLYSDRQEHHDKGAKKAKILGTITIVLAIFDFISSMTSDYSDNIDKILAVATVIIMSICAWKFIKGSNGCRKTIGIFSLFDAGRAALAIFTVPAAINMLNKLLGTSISAAPYIFLAILKAVGFGAMAYFFLLDQQVSDYTTGD